MLKKTIALSLPMIALGVVGCSDDTYRAETAPRSTPTFDEGRTPSSVEDENKHTVEGKINPDAVPYVDKERMDNAPEGRQPSSIGEEETTEENSKWKKSSKKDNYDIDHNDADM